MAASSARHGTVQDRRALRCLRLGLLRPWFTVDGGPQWAVHDRRGEGEGVADAGFAQLPLDRVRCLKRLSAGVIGLQPDDAPPFDQALMLTQEKLPAFSRCGSVEGHHAQAGHQGYQVPQRLNTGAQLSGGRVAVDVPRVGIPWKDMSVVDARVPEKLAHPFSAGIVILDRQEAAALDPACFRAWIPGDA